MSRLSIRWKPLLAGVLALSLLSGCGTDTKPSSNPSSGSLVATDGQGNIVTQPVVTDEQGNIVTQPVVTDEQGNIVTQPVVTDEQGNIVTQPVVTDKQGHVVTQPVVTDKQGHVVTQSKPAAGTQNHTPATPSAKEAYAKPSGAYNYFSDARDLTVWYDCVGTLNAEKKTVEITGQGGISQFRNVFMDPRQSYVYRSTVTPSTDDMLVRLIFKGTFMNNHMYLTLTKDNVIIYDCAAVMEGNPYVPIEIFKCKSDKSSGFAFKGGKSYDVIILTSPSGTSVWIDGVQYFNNVTQANFSKEGAPPRVPKNYTWPEKLDRYLTDTNFLGVYFSEGKQGSKVTLSNVDIYYTTAGLDKSFVDDGSDTNYKSTYKQTQFYMGALYNMWVLEDKGGYAKMADIAKLSKNAGINLAIPYINSAAFKKDPNTFYKAFQAEGIDMLAGTSNTYMPNVLDESKAVADSKAIRSQYSHVIGFYVWDEPTTERFWKVRRLSQMITKSDPAALTMTALLPSYSSYTWTTTDEDMKYTNYISTFINKVKPSVLNMDYYPFQQHGLNCSMKTNGFWKDLGYLTYQAKKNHIPYWHWISGIDEWELGTSKNMNIERIRLQANGCLAYGSKGVLYFGANEAFITNSGAKASKYDAVAALNKQTANIGNLLFKAERTAVYHSTGYTNPGSAYLDTLSASKVIKSLPTTGTGIIASVFTEGSSTYLVAVNKDYSAAASGTIQLKSSYTVAPFDAAANKMGSGTAGSSISYNLQAGGIQVWRLTK